MAKTNKLNDQQRFYNYHRKIFHGSLPLDDYQREHLAEIQDRLNWNNLEVQKRALDLFIERYKDLK